MTERRVFLNLPAADLAASRAFYTALGFEVVDLYTSGGTLCVRAGEHLAVLLHEPATFAAWSPGPVVDAHAATEVLVALSATDRDEVDRLLALALAAGGSPCRPLQDHGPMYACSFRDPDGHVWELVWMDPEAFAGTASGAGAADAADGASAGEPART